MLIAGLLRVGGWIPESVPRALWGWCALGEPLWILCPRILSLPVNKRVTAARHFEILLFEVRADDPSPCPPRNLTPRAGSEQVAHRAGSLCCLSPAGE